MLIFLFNYCWIVIRGKESEIYMVKNRDKSIDYMKAICIILMIYTHTVVEDNMFKTYLFSFHIPAFFIVSGILFERKYKKNDKNISIDYRYIIKKRINQLMIPYLIFCLLLALYFSFNQFISGEKILLVDYFIKIVTFQGIESMWFIPVFFFSELLFLYSNKKFVQSIILILSLILMYFSPYISDYWLICLIIKIGVGYIFIFIGYSISKFDLINKLVSMVAVVLGIVCFCLAQYNGFVGLGSVDFENIFLYLFNASITSLCLLVIIGNYIDKFNISLLSLYGENSIVLLCINNLIIEIVRLIDYKVFNSFLIKTQHFGSLLFTVIILFICYIIIYLMNKVTVLKSVFGKR